MNARVPPTPTVAVISAPVPPPPPCPTKIVIVFDVVSLIAVWIPAIGSPFGLLVIESPLGYGWLPKNPSFEHLNTNPPVSIPTVLLVVKLWFGIVKVRSPLWDS